MGELYVKTEEQVVGPEIEISYFTEGVMTLDSEGLEGFFADIVDDGEGDPLFALDFVGLDGKGITLKMDMQTAIPLSAVLTATLSRHDLEALAEVVDGIAKNMDTMYKGK